MKRPHDSGKKRPAPLFPHVWFAVDCVPDVMKWKVVGFHTKGQQPNNPMTPETTAHRRALDDPSRRR